MASSRSKKPMRSGINGALVVTVIIALARDLLTDAPVWEIVILPLATAIFLAVVWFVNKDEVM